MAEDHWFLHRHPSGGVLAWGNHKAAKKAKSYGFDTLVLCAEELQDRSRKIEDTGLRVFRWGFDDDHKLAERPTFRSTVVKTGVTIASAVKRGHKVLVTCHMGYNRSALVAASAYCQLTKLPGPAVADAVRAQRRETFGNLGFLGIVLSWEA